MSMGRLSRTLKKETQEPETALALSVSVNEDFDRSMTVTGKVTEGTIPLSSTFEIVQLGLREPFIPEDSEEPFEDSSGIVFGVLKTE